MSNPKAVTQAHQDAFNARMRDIAIDTAVRLFVERVAGMIPVRDEAGVVRMAECSVADAGVLVSAIVQAMVVRVNDGDETKS